MTTGDDKTQVTEVLRVVSFNLPTGQHKALKTVAERNERTVSQEIRRAVVAHLKAEKAEVA